MGKVKDIRENFQIIITLGKDEQDVLRNPTIGYKFQDKHGVMRGDYFGLPDNVDVCEAVDEIIKKAQEAIAQCR